MSDCKASTGNARGMSEGRAALGLHGRLVLRAGLCRDRVQAHSLRTFRAGGKKVRAKKKKTLNPEFKKGPDVDPASKLQR